MIVIDIKKQELTFQGKTYPVSTAKNGPGEKNGSSARRAASTSCARRSGPGSR